MIYKRGTCVNKLDNLEEMENSLETSTLLKLNQEEIENLDRPSKGIESVIKIFQGKKPRIKRLHWWILQKIREELKPILLKLFQNA